MSEKTDGTPLTDYRYRTAVKKHSPNQTDTSQEIKSKTFYLKREISHGLHEIANKAFLTRSLHQACSE